MDIGFFPGGKRPGLQVNHSPPSSDEIKNEWSHTSAVHTRLRGVDKEKEKHLSELHASKVINGMSLHPLLILFLLHLLLLLLLLLLLFLLRLLLRVSSYCFICSVFCCMLLNILHSFVDMVLKILHIRPDNLCTKYLYVITLKKKKKNCLHTALFISPTNLDFESIKKNSCVVHRCIT